MDLPLENPPNEMIEYSIALAECEMIRLFEFLITCKGPCTTKASILNSYCAYETHDKASVILRGHKWWMILRHASVLGKNEDIWCATMYFCTRIIYHGTVHFEPFLCYLLEIFQNRPSRARTVRTFAASRKYWERDKDHHRN